MGSSKKACDRLAREKRKAAWNKTHFDENTLPADSVPKTAPKPSPRLVIKVTSSEHSMDNTGSSNEQVEREAVKDVAIEALMTMSQWQKGASKEKLADNIFKQVMMKKRVSVVMNQRKVHTRCIQIKPASNLTMLPVNVQAPVSNHSPQHHLH